MNNTNNTEPVSDVNLSIAFTVLHIAQNHQTYINNHNHHIEVSN